MYHVLYWYVTVPGYLVLDMNALTTGGHLHGQFDLGQGKVSEVLNTLFVHRNFREMCFMIH